MIIIDTLTFATGWQSLKTVLDAAGYTTFRGGTVYFVNHDTTHSITIKHADAIPDSGNDGGVHLVNGQYWRGKIVTSKTWIKGAATTLVDFSTQ